MSDAGKLSARQRRKSKKMAVEDIHSREVDAYVVNEGCVVAAGSVQALEGNRVRPRRDCECGSAIVLIGRVRRSEMPHDDAIDSTLKSWCDAW
jgi:hypothetical protein